MKPRVPRVETLAGPRRHDDGLEARLHLAGAPQEEREIEREVRQQNPTS